MIVRIRQFCCALTTFVRLVSVFFLVFHILLAVASAIWYILRISQKNSVENGVTAAREVDDRTFDNLLIGENENQQGSTEENNANSQVGPHLDLIIGVTYSTKLMYLLRWTFALLYICSAGRLLF